MTIDYNYYPIRSAAILTTSYVAGAELTITNGRPANHNQLVVYVAFTKGSLTTAEVKVEYSNDGVTYYQDTTLGALSGANVPATASVFQLSADGNYRIALPIADAFIKISAKGTGTTTGSSMTIDAALATV